MSAILLGHGYVGSAIADALLRSATNFSWKHHDNWNTDGASMIINAAGYVGTPNVDACEDHPIDCMVGNIAWPLEVERRAGRIPVIHIGSGCIYQGGPYSEDDPPNFTGSLYSATKAAAEKALHRYLFKSYLLRIRMPFGGQTHSRNLLTKLSRYDKLIDCENSLSRIRDVALTVVHFVRRKMPPGIYNVVNPSSVTTREIVSMMGLEKHWFASPEEFMTMVRVPRSNCILKSDKLAAAGCVLPPIRDALASAIGDLNAEKETRTRPTAAD